VASSHPSLVAAARAALAPLLVAASSDAGTPPGSVATWPRLVVGIAGAPAAGKSTLAASLATDLRATDGPTAAVAIGMDGFHLANSELSRLGRAARKGAPETFDAYGFLALLRRLRAADEPVVYAPAYSRTLHESIGSAIPVFAEVRIIVVEGNYLLLPQAPWDQVPDLLDLSVYLETPTDVRLPALVRRQRSRGLDRDAARDWVSRSDEANAALIATTRDRAQVVLSRPH
jgi:pantothenate kinase